MSALDGAVREFKNRRGSGAYGIDSQANDGAARWFINRRGCSAWDIDSQANRQGFTYV